MRYLPVQYTSSPTPRAGNRSTVLLFILFLVCSIPSFQYRETRENTFSPDELIEKFNRKKHLLTAKTLIDYQVGAIDYLPVEAQKKLYAQIVRHYQEDVLKYLAPELYVYLLAHPELVKLAYQESIASRIPVSVFLAQSILGSRNGYGQLGTNLFQKLHDPTNSRQFASAKDAFRDFSLTLQTDIQLIWEAYQYNDPDFWEYVFGQQGYESDGNQIVSLYTQYQLQLLDA